MKRLPILLFCLATPLVALAAELPYDESADARLDIQQAQTQNNPSNAPVIVIFGANWCPDCRRLDLAMKDTNNAARLQRDFKSLSENSEGCCFRGQGWMARRDEGEYPLWVFD